MWGFGSAALGRPGAVRPGGRLGRSVFEMMPVQGAYLMGNADGRRMMPGAHLPIRILFLLWSGILGKIVGMEQLPVPGQSALESGCVVFLVSAFRQWVMCGARHF